MGAAAQLLLGVLAVICSAWLFTNGLEWFGLRLGMGHRALGSIFAALGTALPEAAIAVLAALAPGRSAGAALGDSVSIGAILGAPLLLGTLGFAVLGIAAARARRPALGVSAAALRRDLLFFMGTFGLAALAGILAAPAWLRLILALALLLGYAAFVVATLTAPVPPRKAERPRALVLAGRASGPPSWLLIALQLVLALAAMLGGAELFVRTLTGLAAELRLSGFILAALIAPLATELPETANSLVWIARGQDALATGNVTGALVLQGAVIPALGMLCTPWRFDQTEGLAAAVAIAGALLVCIAASWQRRVRPWPLLGAGALYVAFVVWLL